MSPHDPHPYARLRDAVPTLRHARMLFDLAAEALGTAGLVETAGGGAHRWLFRRNAEAPGLIVPWSILRLTPRALDFVLGSDNAGVGFDDEGRASESRGSDAAFARVNTALARKSESPLPSTRPSGSLRAGTDILGPFRPTVW